MSIYGPDIPPSTVEFLKNFVRSESGAKTGHRRPPIRSSAITDYDKCPRFFLFQDRLGLRPRGSYSSALGIGTFYHAVRHATRTSGGEVERVLAEMVEKETERLRIEAGTSGLLPGGKDIRTVLKDIEQDANLAQAMAAAFEELCPLPENFRVYDTEIRMVPGEMSPFSEVKIETYFPGITQPVVGRIDCVIEDTKTGELWVMDDKTTSTQPCDFVKSLSMSPQTDLYVNILQKAMGRKLAGWVHNVIRVPTIRYCGKDASFSDYCKRVRDWYREENEKNPTKPPVLVSFCRRDHAQADIMERLKLQDKVSRCQPRFDKFYRVTGSCMKFGKACPFLGLCVSNPVVWPIQIESGYEVRFREDEDNQEDGSAQS